MIYLSLIQNIALLVSLTFVHSLLVKRISRKGIAYPFFSGLLFGCVCVIGMMTPVILQPGVIFDGRSIILGVAGLFGGPLAALIAGAIAAAYRFWLGGIGALPGIGVIIGAASLGVTWHYLRRRQQWAKLTPALYIFGLLGQLLMLTILLLTLPGTVAHEVSTRLALPMLLLYPPATLLVCLLFQTMEKHNQADETLRQSEERMRLFFERQLVGMAITSPEKGWLQVNDKLCLMLGYTPEEFALLTWADLTHPDDLARDLAEFNHLLSGKIDDYSIEKRFIHKDGAIVHTNLSIGCVRKSDGSVDYILALFEDITARKQADKALRFSEMKFSTAFHVSPDAISISRLSDGLFRDINEGFTAITGYSAADVSGKTSRDLGIWVEPEARTRLVRALSEHGVAHNLEEQCRRKDGMTYTCLESARLIELDGEPCILSISRDITERKLLEVKYKEDQRFLQTILDSITDLVFYKDKNGIFLGCNDAYASRYIGLPKDQIIGHPDSDFIPDREMISKYVGSDRQAMGSNSPVLLKTWITQINGQKALVEVLKTPFHDSFGQVAGVIGVARDITDHNLALEAITREKKAAQRYLDIAGVMFCALNRAGEIILINKKGSQILGYPDNEPLGRNWFDVCLPEAVRERVKEVFAHQLAGDLAPVEFYENTIINRNGEERLIAFHNTLLHDEEGISGVLFSGEDITEQRMLQEERLKNQKLESLGVLAGGIAHDFNNILTGILGNISFAKRTLDTPDKARKLLENAEKASLRAASLAGQLLTFAKGGTPIKKRMTISPILEESLSLSLRGANVKGVVDISESLHAIEADEGQLSQVFNNLIINAMQAMPDGGALTIRAGNLTMEPHNKALLPPGEYVMLSFTDQGCGISDEDQKKIFDPYFTTKSDGSGLGLASAHSIISKHGGRIDVCSLVGTGTTITIYLPSLHVTTAEQDTDKDSLAAARNATGAILVLDDEELIRKITTEVLEHLGYQVRTCVSGEEAIMMYKTAKESDTPFFATIMDLTIPGGMGGLEAAQQILEYDPSARLVVSSGYSNDPVMAQYNSYGFSAAITKPYTLDHITRILAELGKST